MDNFKDMFFELLNNTAREMNWKQIDNYCTNNITRLDVFVLCKLCTVLECKIEDLLVFYPPEKK